MGQSPTDMSQWPTQHCAQSPPQKKRRRRRTASNSKHRWTRTPWTTTQQHLPLQPPALPEQEVEEKLQKPPGASKEIRYEDDTKIALNIKDHRPDYHCSTSPLPWRHTVIFSKTFFESKWPLKELLTFAHREEQDNSDLILPVVWTSTVMTVRRWKPGGRRKYMEMDRSELLGQFVARVVRSVLDRDGFRKARKRLNAAASKT